MSERVLADGRACHFRISFRRRFRIPFPIRRSERAGFPHRFADPGRSVLPTSPRSIEVWS
jgi:hypothetical protein